MVGRSAKTIQVLHKVVGVADLYAWACGQRQWEEVNPRTVKCLIGGKADATKEQVAEELTPYVGKQAYACDDESDAVAVAIAWLIKTKRMKGFRDVRGYMKQERYRPRPKEE